MKRDAYFDNAKLILIFLVVFGHLIQPFIDKSTGIHTLYTWMYTFHMPAFIFLAGFFAKGAGNFNYIFKLARKLIIPYIIFQVIYTIFYMWLGKDGWFTDTIFYPHWSLWFLFSLFCWHVLLVFYKKLPAITGIAIAVAVGILIGFFDQVGHTFSLSRTFVFFPYFLIGYWVTKEQVMLLKRRSVKIGALLVLSTFAIVIYYLPDINSGWLLASKSYGVLGLEGMGAFARLAVYTSSALMAVSVLAWMPQKRLAFTNLGTRTLYVYLLHGFFIQYFRATHFFEVNQLMDLIGLAVVSAVIIYILASNITITLTQPLIEVSVMRLKTWRQQRNGVHDRDVSA